MSADNVGHDHFLVHRYERKLAGRLGGEIDLEWFACGQ